MITGGCLQKVKMNFDGVLSTIMQKVSTGIVVWNSKGECLTMRTKFRSICSSLLVESKAALLGIQTPIAMRVKKIIVEGDQRLS